jgi:hypothetical protein
MSMPLNIMVLESERGVADRAIGELTEAGHVVLRCHDRGASVFPCRGLVDASTCPQRSHVIDVALTVRSGWSFQPTSTEDGARCALMSHVPLVVAGPSAPDPYVGLETRVVDRPYDVVAACEEAASAELVPYARRAEAVITETIGAGAVPRVSVTRRAGGLVVRVAGLEARTDQERRAAVVRIVGAMRELDSSARAIDVVLAEASA